MDNIYKVLEKLDQVATQAPVMESDKEATDHMQETPFSSDSVAKLLDAEQTIAGIKSELKGSMMSRLAELAGVPLAEIEEAIGESPEDAAARIKEGHCEACGCEMANPDPTCECGASGGKIMVTMDEDEVEEGNEFSGALAQAKKDGKEEFEVDGKTYKVSEAAKPDFADIDGDGDKDEDMKKAAKDKEKMDEEKEECRYCGGDCPNDEDNACDGYLGDIDGLYAESVEETTVDSGEKKTNNKNVF